LAAKLKQENPLLNNPDVAAALDQILVSLNGPTKALNNTVDV